MPIRTDFVPSTEWAAVTTIFPELFGRVLIQIAPTPPLSVSRKGLSPTATPGPVSSKATSPPANGRRAPNLSTVWKTSRVASEPSPINSRSSAASQNWSLLRSDENDFESAILSPRYPSIRNSGVVTPSRGEGVKKERQLERGGKA